MDIASFQSSHATSNPEPSSMPSLFRNNDKTTAYNLPDHHNDRIDEETQNNTSTWDNHYKRRGRIQEGKDHIEHSNRENEGPSSLNQVKGQHNDESTATIENPYHDEQQTYPSGHRRIRSADSRPQYRKYESTTSQRKNALSFEEVSPPKKSPSSSSFSPSSFQMNFDGKFSGSSKQPERMGDT